MTRTRSIQMLTACAALTLAVVPRAYAQDVSEARIQDLLRQASARVAASGQAGGAGQPTTVQQASGPSFPLSMDDLVKLTLERNLSIAVQRLNPQVSDINIANAYTQFHPIVSSTISQASTISTPSNQTSLASGGAGPTTDTFTYNGQIAESFAWGGSSLAVSINNSRQTTNSASATCTPCFSPFWQATFTQPLLQNFKIDSNRQQLLVAKVNRDMSDVQLRSTITNTVANAQTAYWEYVYASQAVEVAQDSLRIAHQLVQDNQTRVEVGTMAPLDVLTAQSQEATAQQTLVAAQATKRTDEIALKQFFVGGADDPNWNATIKATDQPDFNPQPVDLEAALRRALSERTDLQLAKYDVQENDITLKFLRDQLKPQANLTVNYGLSGLGGTILTRGSGLNSGITGTDVTGFTGAYGTLFRNDYPRWTVGLNLSYPLFLSTQEAQAARARVQLSQVDAQVKQVQLQIATDITNAVVSVQNSVEAERAANVAVDLAQRELDAEQSKFDVGMSTNYNVVLAQQTLSTARQSELRAIANYREALVSLDRLQQTTLTSANITILVP